MLRRDGPGRAGQPPGICEVPLETFTDELDRLADAHDRICLLGTSKGAEAALLVAAHEPRVAAVIAVAPTDVAWANVGAGLDGRDRPQRSSWTRRGAPVPFVPYDERWEPSGTPPSYLDLYRRSREAHPDAVTAAAIPVERIRGSVVLVAGGDDRVWDSLASCRRIERRRRDAGLPTAVVSHPRAGHRLVLPGEAPASGGQAMQRGGTPEVDAALGAAAWPVVLGALAGER